MSLEQAVNLVERQDWLEPVESGLQKAVEKTYASAGETGRQVQDFLHGTWLGHPLHPMLTDVPLGAWLVTAVLDAMEASGRRDCKTGADVSLQIGLAGAGWAILGGLTDWHKVDGRARRVGLTHGLLNVLSTGLYFGSMVARRRRARQNGRALALAGFVISTAAAYLGGNLVYGKKIGVNHAQPSPGPAKWHGVIDAADLPEGKLFAAEVRGVRVLLLRRGEEIYCINSVCSHLGGPLSEGTVEGDTVTCPWHGSCFSLRDGSVGHGPATNPQPAWKTRAHHGRVEVQPVNPE